MRSEYSPCSVLRFQAIDFDRAMVLWCRRRKLNCAWLHSQPSAKQPAGGERGPRSTINLDGYVVAEQEEARLTLVNRRQDEGATHTRADGYRRHKPNAIKAIVHAHSGAGY